MRSALIIALLLALSACTPTSRVAQPDLIMKSAQLPADLTPCLAGQLGREFGDANPRVLKTRQGFDISIEAPRGGLLGYVNVLEGDGVGSVVKFYSGDLYWPDNEVSGVYPDIARDNWHRAERAMQTCNQAAAK